MVRSNRTLQEFRTTLPAAEVIARAKDFFTNRNGIYSTFLEHEGPTYVSFRGQGNEELVIGCSAAEGGTLVTGSTYLFDMQISRFYSTLPAPASSPQPAAAVGVDATPTPTTVPEAAR
jgi:hypothetical protein